jgi:hypothetical protein
MRDVAFVTLMAISAALVGRAVVRRLCAPTAHWIDELALAVPVGLGLVGLATLALGTIGALGRTEIAAVLTGGVMFAVCQRGRRAEVCADLACSPSEGPRSLRLGFDLVLGTVLIGTFLTALAPVTDGDALCYHLQVPKVFLEHRATVYDPDLHETVYPLLTETLYTVALAFRGPVACRLVQWVLGVVFAANVTALARLVLGSRARWAGTIALLVPAVSNGMGAPLNDVSLAAFGAAALHAWMRWRDRPTTGDAVLAGLLAGLTLGVKCPALVWVGLLGLLTAWRARRQPALLALFAATAVLVGGGWYLRAYLATGNPVHPFFRHTFGVGIDEVLDPAKRPLVVTPLSLAMALAPLTLDPDRFDSFAHQLGPVFLLLAPGLLLVRTPRRVLGLAALGWAFMAICLTQRQSMRFLLIAVGPMAVAAAWLVAMLCQRKTLASRFLLAVFGVILALEAALALGRARHGIGVVLGREPAASFLRRREPTFGVGHWVGANLPADARIVGQDHRGFYIPRPYTMELAHRRRTGLGRYGESADQIVAALRRAGFTHVLLCPPVPMTAVEFDPTLCQRLEPWLARCAPLFREEITDGDGVVRRYSIYDLQAVPRGSAPVLAATRGRGGHG